MMTNFNEIIKLCRVEEENQVIKSLIDSLKFNVY